MRNAGPSQPGDARQLAPTTKRSGSRPSELIMGRDLRGWKFSESDGMADPAPNYPAVRLRGLGAVRSFA